MNVRTEFQICILNLQITGIFNAFETRKLAATCSSLARHTFQFIILWLLSTVKEWHDSPRNLRNALAVTLSLQIIPTFSEWTNFGIIFRTYWTSIFYSLDSYRLLCITS